MMLNVFNIKKYAALIIVGMLPVILFTIGLFYFKSFWIALLMIFPGLLISILLANALLSNPFTQMIEGKGILALDLNSTGVIRPFIVTVKPPYIRGKLGGKWINDIFDRAAVFNLAAPEKNKKPAEPTKEGGIKIELNEKQYNEGRFALFHYPVLIWNEALQTILTKDKLSDMEKGAFAEHGVLYLNRKMEELTSAIRDFGRYVVELTKPKKESIWKSKLFWIVVVIALIIILLLFATPVINVVKEAGGGLLSGTETITPKT